MNTKHTPGPWKMQPSQHDERHYAIHAASAMRWVAHVSVENNEANARLIAAAPELLEALQDAADQLFRLALADAHRWPGDASGTKALEHANRVCEPFRAAIAKATGETI